MNPYEMIGKQFERLTVVGFHGKTSDRKLIWECVCSCGNHTTATGIALRTGQKRSCGCLRDESTAARFTKHGMRESREYSIWQNMKNRCSDPKNLKFAYYGGKGVSVCPEWSDSFENFFRDMGECPTDYTIERMNNNRGYEPGNCVWASRKQQARNRRTNRFIEYQGRHITVSELAEGRTISPETLLSRIKSGWEMDRALNQPVAHK